MRLLVMRGPAEVPWAQDALQVLLECPPGEGTWNCTNATLNATHNGTNPPELLSDAFVTGITSVFLGLMILVTIIGE